jgi:hypothetical protein
LNCCGHRDHHRHQGHQHDGRYTHERCALGERVRATGAGERGPCRDGGTRGMMTSRQRSDVLPRPLGAKRDRGFEKWSALAWVRKVAPLRNV